ncbi:class GN sortase [Sphingomonas sp. ac-8]|uniref:class GN sortase n=1 Tax=Sphingomonas sp. ac-8 TaxID=3242977 RepID=UPI003A7FF215
MTAATLPAITGGRACGRVLQLALLALCAFGLVLLGRSATIPAKAWAAQILLDRAFTRSLADGRSVKPWPWADTAPVARIALPRLGVRQVILSGGSGQAMAFGPTALPAPQAQGRVTILAAHRDTHFAFLADAKIGDVVTVQPVAGATQRYRIRSFAVVRHDRFAYPRDPTRPLLLLTTCYPFGATERGPLRLVVAAEQIGGAAATQPQSIAGRRDIESDSQTIPR